MPESNNPTETLAQVVRGVDALATEVGTLGHGQISSTTPGPKNTVAKRGQIEFSASNPGAA